MMVAWLSASKSVQSMATTMEVRAPITKGTQRTRMSSTSMAGLESKRSTCLIACFGFKLRAAARPWPMAQIARRPLCNRPRVALHSEPMRFRVEILLQQAAEHVVDCLIREALPDDHGISRIGVGKQTRWSAERPESLL